MSRDAHLYPEGAYQCPGGHIHVWRLRIRGGECVFTSGVAYSCPGGPYLCPRSAHSLCDDVLVSRGCILVSIRTQNRSIACLAVCTCVRACVRVSVRADTCVFVDIWCAYVCVVQLIRGRLEKNQCKKCYGAECPLVPRKLTRQTK